MKLIMAVNKDLVIADKDGRIPWKCSEDMKMFKELTTGSSCLMGRKTWESLPRRPLPGRKNLIMSRSNLDLSDFGPDVEQIDIKNIVWDADFRKNIFVIGGAEIYRYFLFAADEIYLTLIEDYETKEDDIRFDLKMPGYPIVSFERLREDILKTYEEETYRVLKGINNGVCYKYVFSQEKAMKVFGQFIDKILSR